jgi:hypothetical protein
MNKENCFDGQQFYWFRIVIKLATRNLSSLYGKYFVAGRKRFFGWQRKLILRPLSVRIFSNRKWMHRHDWARKYFGKYLRNTQLYCCRKMIQSTIVSRLNSGSLMQAYLRASECSAKNGCMMWIVGAHRCRVRLAHRYNRNCAHGATYIITDQRRNAQQALREEKCALLLFA